MDYDAYNHNANEPFSVDSAYYCQAGCQLTSYCMYFVFMAGNPNKCYYKSGSNDGNFVTAHGSISGQKFCDGKLKSVLNSKLILFTVTNSLNFRFLHFKLASRIKKGILI